MGVKYRCEYKAFDNVNWKVEISLPTYNDEPIILTGVSEQVCVLNYDSEETDNLYSPFVKSSLAMSFYNQGNIDVSELQLSQDRTLRVVWYKENSVEWTGYITSEGIERAFTTSTEAIDLTAVCGLTLLDDMSYKHENLPVDKANTMNVRCPLNYIRQILFSVINLGLPLPIRWSNNLRCTAFNDDAFAGKVAWAVDDVGLYSFENNIEIQKAQTCGYILRGFMQAFGCRLYQADGRWNIRRINLIPSKTFGFKQIQGNLGLISIVTGTESPGKNIGSNNTNAYPFIREDAKILVEPGLKSVKVEYQANIPENILPNGSQDKLIPLLAVPYYWGYPTSFVSPISRPPIDGRKGYSSHVYNPGIVGVDDPIYFVLNRDSQTLFGLPIDAKILVPRIQFGFTFSVLSGFPLDGDGYIDFTNKPLRIQVLLNTYFGVFYLNENGFWQSTDVYIGITPADNIKVKPNDVVKIDFNRFQGILLPEPDDELDPTKEYTLKVRFEAKPQQEYLLDNIYINVEQNNDVYEAELLNSNNTKSDEISLNISSSYGGYMQSNLMTAYSESGNEFEYSEGAFTTGSLTSILARAIMRCKYAPQRKIDLTINTRNLDWSFDEFYTVITFGTSVFVPVKASFNSDLCEVKLTIIECRNDNVSLYTKHYGSNDNLLSN